MASRPPVVPYDGPPKGRWAIAVKRAISRAGYMQWAPFTKENPEGFTKVWGKFADRACRNFEHDHGVPVTGKYPKATHDALVKTHRKGSSVEWAWDDYSIAIAKNESVSPWQKAAYRILDSVTWSIDHQLFIGYEMFRPFPVYATYPVNHHWDNDCSGMFAQWFRWGDAPDPHRNSFDGYGNTATLWEYGEPVSSLKNAEYCDAVLYGTPWRAGASAHVTILRRYSAGVWYAGSHGRDSGPNETRADYRVIEGIRRFPLLHS